MAHRSGFVCIIGNPNVGKSTLMNALVGEKLSIVTAKAQTTRHRIMGIVNGEDWQIVYSDTPGILKPSYRLQQNMMNFVDGAIGDADVILYVTDTVETPDKNSEYVEKLSQVDCPVIVVINKIDISDQPRVTELLAYWQEKLPAATVIPASAYDFEAEAPAYQRLRSGSYGMTVFWMQKTLEQLGYFKDTTATGYFGPMTASALKRFQKASGLSQDGVLGQKTYDKLVAAQKEKQAKAATAGT